MAQRKFSEIVGTFVVEGARAMSTIIANLRLANVSMEARQVATMAFDLIKDRCEINDELREEHISVLEAIAGLQLTRLNSMVAEQEYERAQHVDDANPAHTNEQAVKGFLED